jgi:hypothetical protein
MNSFLIIALGVSNLFLALFTFVLLAMAAGVRKEWRLGYLMESDRKRLLQLGRSLGIPLLIFLFTWSFLCGVLIRLLG